MNKILLPIDFSSLSEYAWNIAEKIALQNNSKITALHVVPGPFGAYYTKSGELLNDEGNDYSEWKKRQADCLDKLKLWSSDKSAISSTICQIGPIDKTIQRIAEEEKADFIIMGTEGVHHDQFWNSGSHTVQAKNNLSIPILSLKCDRSTTKFDKMVLVSDFSNPSSFNIQPVVQLQKTFDTELLLLKVLMKKEDSSSHNKSLQEMHEFADKHGLQQYSANIYVDDNIESGINKFCAENGVEMISIGTHQSKAFSKLFKQNVSDDVLKHLYYPILTFPI